MKINYRYVIFLILTFDVLILLFKISDLSISYKETLIIYGEPSFLQFILKFSMSLFGENDFALRLPMILLHLSSALLLYSISKEYIKKEKDMLWLVTIFLLLPGVISSAIVVNNAGLVIFGLLLFIFIYQKFNFKYLYPLLLVYSLVESDFLYLFFSLSIFALYKKDYNFLVYNIFLLFLSIYLYNINIYGIPKGHFLDVVGVYSAVFTPIIFIYIVYTLYRRYLIKEIDILWFIASIPFLLSFILAFRQKIYIEDFAPYLIISLPLIIQTFYRSYRIRLPLFRKKYKIIFTLSLVFLFLNSFVVLFNKELYRIVSEPKYHFAYKMHVVKELALELNKRDIECITTNKKMSVRLKFYGIDNCDKYELKETELDAIDLNNVTISYVGRVVYQANVTKINTE